MDVTEVPPLLTGTRRGPDLSDVPGSRHCKRFTRSINGLNMRVCLPLIDLFLDFTTYLKG